MIFFGTQPTFTHVPPSLPDSASTTFAPCSAARCAAAIPPLPPPITTRSYFSAMAPSLTPALFMLSKTRSGYEGRYNGPPAMGRDARMDNPLLHQDSLPQFMRIRP